MSLIEPVIVQKSAEELKQRRKDLLRSIGLTRPTQLRQIASERALDDSEERVAYELESIAFLLGESPVRIG